MNGQELIRGSELLHKYNYSYGQIDPQSGSVDTTKNNGQLAQVESYTGGTASSPTKQFTQKFSYDSIGRLEKENEYRGDNGNQVYQQKFSFDRFGNRYLKASENPSNQNPLAPSPIEDNNIERATNRFAANTGTVYDDAGNVVSDDKFREMDFVYDANGRMAKATKANFPEALSVFDAGGNKVATRVNDVWRFQIYDAGGKCVAEYGGPQSADDGGVKYTHQDVQGSTRTISTQAGFAQARMDYQAFGEQISSGIGQRTTSGYTASDTLRNRYALTERDEATGLDDTWFRKLENRGGRWTSPDPYNGSALVGNPQSFNRYAYVENQPTNYVDPSGLLALSWVCWDVTTYSHAANDPLHTRTDTTTQCSAIWVGGGDGGGDLDVDFGGGSGGDQAPPPLDTDPCDGKKGNLDFSQTMGNHIFPRHIATSTFPNKSKYTFWPTQTTREQYESQVVSFGQTTFENGKVALAGNSAVYTYAFFGIDRGDRWLFREVGVSPITGQATNVNTVVVKTEDCKTVITSYPGLPRQFGRSDIPGAIFRSGGWSTQHRSPF